MAQNDEHEGADMADNIGSDWTNWQKILEKAEQESKDTGKSEAHVLNAHILAEIRMIRQYEQESREQQASVWEGVIGAVSQGLAMWRAGRKK